MTLPNTDTLLRQWATWQRGQGLVPRTIANRATQVRKLEAHACTPASEVTIEQILDYIGDCGPSRTTKATYYGLLRAWFRWLCRAGHREDDPTLQAKAPRAARTSPRPVADAHLPVLLAIKMWPRTRVMILLAALAGLRVHEIAKVKGEDIDVVGRRIRVEGKGGVVADLPLHPLLVEAAATMPRTGWWFPSHPGGNRPGKPVKGQSVSTIIGDAMRRAGIPGGAHRLRHWFGTTLVDSGADLRTAQTLLRHASLATTQIYTAPSEGRRVAAIGALDPWRIAA